MGQRSVLQHMPYWLPEQQHNDGESEVLHPLLAAVCCNVTFALLTSTPKLEHSNVIDSCSAGHGPGDALACTPREPC